ncbi:hypothetical protein EKE94_08325 [Mesobaculum littorinae]|uniref:Uncharacterized protein n=1 Tax=Mesobaculum littorinae TaxID=2486419 RepID=A0A438AJR9_9RHOB|nr:hypothetical protein [Mesobaculum littorinae]RVV98886.1 hypothetical protein EKE94_08325 [Mesobaculum littorinae]
MILRPALVLVAMALANPAGACATASTGAKCASVGDGTGLGGGAGKWLKAPERVVEHDVGGTLPRGEFNVVLNTAYHGLPPATADWLWYSVGYDYLRVDRRTMEILERRPR